MTSASQYDLNRSSNVLSVANGNVNHDVAAAGYIMNAGNSYNWAQTPAMVSERPLPYYSE